MAEETVDSWERGMYGGAVTAIRGELALGARHHYLIKNDICLLTTEGPKLLGDEIERKEKLIQEKEAGFRRMEDLACRYINKLTETENKLAATNLVLAAKDEGYTSIIKGLREELEKAEEENRKLNWKLTSEEQARICTQKQLNGLTDFVGEFCEKFEDGDF